MDVTSQNPEKFYDYEGFVEKFSPKKTTDDCYTPPLVYDAVADWTAAAYGLDRADFVRPFYPGGDYEHFDYAGKIVVDNPPFSILSKIIDFYVGHGIRFMLFAPTLCGLVRYADFCTVLLTGVQIEYENGAVVNTSFVTNLDPYEIRCRTVPGLYADVDAANKENKAKKYKPVAKYAYPMELVTTGLIYPYAQYGIEFVIPREESVRVSRLDAQAGTGKSIFGCGWLISDRLTAERQKAERQKAELFPLSERERGIIEKMKNTNRCD